MSIAKTSSARIPQLWTGIDTTSSDGKYHEQLNRSLFDWLREYTERVGQLATIVTGRGQIAGAKDNGTASAGNVGELIAARVGSGAAVSLTSATLKNVTTITLTPGEWDVSAEGCFLATAAGTTFNNIGVGIGISNSAFAAEAGASGLGPDPTEFIRITGSSTPSGTYAAHGVGPVWARVATGATLPLYLNVIATITAGTVSVFGGIRARRVR